MSRDDIVGYVVPAVTLGLGLLLWEGIVRYFAIPPYLLPAPSVIIATLISDWPTLSGSLWVTLSITLKALLAAVIGSVTLAVLFAQSRLVERAFYPFAVAMQVTPIVAIAPLLLIYLTPSVAVLVCAFLVAFFPLLANTTLGLSSADHNLVDLFRMYRASRFEQFMLLRLPSALPYFLAGLRISGSTPDQTYVEMVEIPEHPYFLGCQFHPEFKSKPLEPHPLFFEFVKASYENRVNHGAVVDAHQTFA